MLGRIAEFFIFGFMPFVVGALAFPFAPLAAEKTISGEILYRERIALPPNAVLTVELADVSLADAPASIIGKQVIDPAGQVPIKFTISFDPAVIQPNMQYALQARITVNDTLWFINDARYTIAPLTDTAPSLLLKMVRRSETPAPAANIYDAIWVSEDPASVGMPPTFSVKTDGKMFGKGPCNSYFGTAEIGDGTIAVGEVGSTRMACAPDVMDRERAFFETLRKAESFDIREGRLTLKDKDGKEILHFSHGA
ncbi:YbaY family lipoprotein [Mesorhizobium sp. 1B3]|uniref:YbaY family lipoprotein n=1 Tax=Mesorhizobium sp. 1B3 TaxID=3243599 RepID=UPI003D959989